MAFSPETFETLWGLEYATFKSDATYKLHPIVILSGDDRPLAGSYELGKGNTIPFRELGAFVAHAEKLVVRSNVEGVLVGVVLTSTLETTQFAASILVAPPEAEMVPLRDKSFITWLYGPMGSGTGKHLKWYRRFMDPIIGINRMPEPIGYAEAAGDIVACVPTNILHRHRPHLAVYANTPAAFALTNAISSDPEAMRQRLNANHKARAANELVTFSK